MKSANDTIYDLVSGQEYTCTYAVTYWYDDERDQFISDVGFRLTEKEMKEIIQEDIDFKNEDNND